METNQQSKDVVGGFFSAFGKGDINGVIESFHDSCTITAVRPSGRSESDVYGSYQGKDGVRSFLSNLGKAFDTKAFSVSHIIGEGAIAFANGSFTHILRSTGKPYTSDWALMCVVKDNKILEYHFYEDSGKFAEAQK
ncbi:MAG: nuclear transport factor 2 family protein [Chitinophagaceae bacterium]|nr:MAG: nuclear transport factor 2 family protein [Chitinophagaceae bacterium]